MAKKKLLSEYEAAATVGMSPTLLRWFASYAAKSGDSRKLKIAKEENGIVFFEEQELLSFNDWLRLPWPHKPGKRPNIPVGIREEIKAEANGACADEENAEFVKSFKTTLHYHKRRLWVMQDEVGRKVRTESLIDYGVQDAESFDGRGIRVR
jgi:hypothetical protein